MLAICKKQFIVSSELKSILVFVQLHVFQEKDFNICRVIILRIKLENMDADSMDCSLFSADF